MKDSEKVLDLIRDSKNILLHLHPKPDPDSIGSALATYHALKDLGKEVTVMEGDTPLPESFSFLPGFDVIVRKDYFGIDLADFDLFIIQDSSSKEFITRKQEIAFPAHLKTVVIDHHKTNKLFADINIVDPTYAATAELLYELFVGWGIVITKDIAACLYVGMYSDSGGFRYSSTTPRTLKIAAQLAEVYPNFTQLIEKLWNNNTRGFISFEALAVESIETYFNNTVAVSAIPYDALTKRGITREDTDRSNVGNTFLSVKEWKVGAILIEKAPGEIKVSLRSKDDKYDMAKVALLLGGGGHTKASGFVLMMPLSDAKKKVIDAIGEVC